MAKAKSHQIRIKGYKPVTRPNKEQCKALRQVITEVIFARYLDDKQPVKCIHISTQVLERIETEAKNNLWSFPKWRPSYASIERQLRACADTKYYPNGTPRLAAVKAGWYVPNPALFEQSNKPITVHGTIKTELSDALWFNAFNEWLSSRSEYYTKEVK